MPRRATLLMTVVLGVVAMLSACSFALPFQRPSKTPSSQASNAAIPPCMPPLSPTTVEAIQPGIPQHTAQITGTEPYLPTRLPPDVVWNIAVVLGKPWQVGPVPLFHAAYGVWLTRPNGGAALHTVIAFDETTGSLQPDTNITISGISPRITNEQAITLENSAARIFELDGGVVGDANSTRIVGLIWKFGSVNIRETAVLQGSYDLFPDGNGAYLDHVDAWTGASEKMLIELAKSTTRFTDCR